MSKAIIWIKGRRHSRDPKLSKCRYERSHAGQSAMIIVTMPRFSDGFKREGVPEMMDHGFRSPAVKKKKKKRWLDVWIIFSAEMLSLHIK